MRIATFNILHGRSPVDDRVDESRFHEAIRSLDADLLGLQEVDRHQPRSHRADLTAIAADAMGTWHHLFVPALTGTPGAWSAATGDEPPDSPGYGVALLSRYDVLGWRVVRLPVAPVPDEPRVAVVAEVGSPLGPIDVVTTHLSFLPPWTERQLRRLMAELAPRTNPLVLLGDLNLGPAAARRVTGLTALAEGLTFPADRPRWQLDHVLGDGLPEPVGSRVVRLQLSDHRALVVDL